MKKLFMKNVMDVVYDERYCKIYIYIYIYIYILSCDSPIERGEIKNVSYPSVFELAGHSKE